MTEKSIESRWIETASIDDPWLAVKDLIDLGIEEDPRALKTAARICPLIEAQSGGDGPGTLEKRGMAYYAVGLGFLEVGQPGKAMALRRSIDKAEWQSKLLNRVSEYYLEKGNLGKARHAAKLIPKGTTQVAALKQLADAGDTKAKRRLIRVSKTRRHRPLEWY